MRITQQQRQFIKSSINEIISDSQIYLFGSRANDSLKGGDIDILILSSKTVLKRNERNQIRKQFCHLFGEQKLDIVSYLIDQQDAFKDVALENAILI